ncbi:diguanylate cyclase (GGDEF)-like protein [Neorhizobium galegae]|uniref:putative bifunctional diguanylate cyclase/phosphodiesterase n=1 Tax=Neorhizobium galegae TaxID=399 RepID=UPI001AE41E52|nr:bifunctional diguanylate cyclase/phosphodiesterase [Neorhizobium galegae]MBP2551512.1 diguanylate cyclase (GGDEF)-like protein [Neorhizobium galegae]
MSILFAKNQLLDKAEDARSFKRWLYVSLVRLAFRNNFANITVNLAAGFGFVLIIWPSEEMSESFLAQWLVALSVLSLARLTHSFFVIKRLRDEPDITQAQLRPHLFLYAAGLLTAAGLWGIITASTVLAGHEESRHAALVIIPALAAGATGILASQRVIGRIYISVMLLQGSLALALAREPEHLMAVLGVIFTIVMLIAHRNNHQVLRQSFELQFRNNDLVEKLEAERSLLENLNATLEARVRQRTAELKELAAQDPLTRVLNRSGLMQWCAEQEESVSASAGFAAIFIDLDRFKQINDGLGHTVGDIVLVEVARRLDRALGAHGALGRWGGDEFVAIVRTPQERPEDWSCTLVDRMRAAVEEPIAVAGRQLQVGFSAGVAATGSDRLRVTDAIHCADLAAGDAKRKGRGVTQIYRKTLLAEQERNLALVQALKQAIANREFSVVFQPVVQAGSHAVHSHEVLLRWNNPDYGLVSPDEFIPIAEDTGEIVTIGAFVLDTALREIARTADPDGPRRLAVNVSLRQLIAPGFFEVVRSTLERHQARPEDLVLEVTESIFDTRRQSIIKAVLLELHLYGVEIHIDDFGTGYSSLSRLHEMPVQALKIDRSFVQALDSHGHAIIEGTALIARKLGIAIVAEGVETAQQVAELEALGIDYLQGYFFGRPSPALARPPQSKSA